MSRCLCRIPGLEMCIKSEANILSQLDEAVNPEATRPSEVTPATVDDSALDLRAYLGYDVRKVTDGRANIIYTGQRPETFSHKMPNHETQGR